MSVQTWKRKLSSAEYVFQLYQLNIRLGEILINKPKKYKTNYADEIVRTALSALEDVQIADSIYFTKNSSEQEYLVRRERLILARGKIQHVATASFIFLEIVRKHDYASQINDTRNFAKIYDQEIEIGDLCEKCHNLISGIMKSDKEIYRKYIKAKI